MIARDGGNVFGTVAARARADANAIGHWMLRHALAWSLVLLPTVGFAHVDPAGAGDGGFVSGLWHPVTGLDHVAAMVAVGLWGAQLGTPAMWLLPVVFPLMMAIGGVLGVIGTAVPGVGVGVAASAILLGSVVAAEARPPLAVAMLMVGSFAIFHGHVHGTALPTFGVPVLFASGFVLATGVLHLCGIVIGLLRRWPAGRLMIRGAGVVVALVGAYSLAIPSWWR